MFDWSTWLREKPQPSRLLVHFGLGKEPETLKPTHGANRWNGVVSRILAAIATGEVDHIDAVDKAGGLIRSADAEGRERDGDDDVDDEDDETPNGGKFIQHMKAWDRRAAEKAYADAAILDRHGNYMMHAFREGVAASSSQQEHLVGLVETLTAHLSSAITSLHTVSVNFANTMASLTRQEDDDGRGQVSQNSEMLSKVLGEAAARMMTGPPPNGASPREGKKP